MNLVIGYGNTLRRDDGVGPAAARALEHRGAPPDTEIIALFQLTPELAEPISRADTVIFVDASVHDGGAPGDVRETRLSVPDDPHLDPGAFTHNVTPLLLVVAAHGLYGRAPDAAWLITVSAGSFDLGEGLSAPVQAALSRVVSRIEALLGSDSRTGS
ncbi:MAG: hydrogenase maturation protease [Anaerolineae bacterium]|nr:hydrogenase maturation protease [Anaerolineae bacterium]